MASDAELTSYTELAGVLAALPLLLRAERRRRRLSVRASATELGCSFSTVSRIEAGHDCALSNAMAVLRWLDGHGETEPHPAVAVTDLTPVDRAPTTVPCANCGGSGMDSTTVVTDPYPIDMPHPCGYCEGGTVPAPVDRAATTRDGVPSRSTIHSQHSDKCPDNDTYGVATPVSA